MRNQPYRSCRKYCRLFFFPQLPYILCSVPRCILQCQEHHTFDDHLVHSVMTYFSYFKCQRVLMLHVLAIMTSVIGFIIRPKKKKRYECACKPKVIQQADMLNHITFMMESNLKSWTSQWLNVMGLLIFSMLMGLNELRQNQTTSRSISFRSNPYPIMYKNEK